MDNNIAYKEAIERLEAISKQISSGEMDVDELASKLKEAKELVKFCQDKLKHVEEDVKKILED